MGTNGTNDGKSTDNAPQPLGNKRTIAVASGEKLANYSLDNILESIHLNWHPRNREERFPSVDKRVKVYMSNWYLPCHNSSQIGIKVGYYNGSYPEIESPEARIDSVIRFDRPLILHRDTLDICLTNNESYPLYKERIHGFFRAYGSYCQDSMDIFNLKQNLDDSDTKSSRTNMSNIPLIVQFGDGLARSRIVPIISKYRRRALNEDSLEQVSCQDPYLRTVRSDSTPSYQPIIWNLNSNRHFGKELAESRSQDIPWESKKVGALWIGAMTGGKGSTKVTRDMSSSQICQMNARCNFVYQHQNSSLVQARLTSSSILSKEDAPQLFGRPVSKKDILQYKVVISLEGNDVSSGLKWSLLSNSVVMMPPPMTTSWLMEELLEPWVHYIPLRQDGSNAEEMIKWVGENDLKARRIAERGVLFMYDLLYHPDAEKDDILVKKEILRRYRQFWNHVDLDNSL